MIYLRKWKDTLKIWKKGNRIIKRASSKLGLEEIGTHTMRKSFGYHHYQQYKDVALLQEIYNHSSPSITLKYIGINQDNIDLGYRDFSI